MAPALDEGELVVDDGMGQVRVFHEPVGIVGAITPWNWPFALTAVKVVPALLAGQRRHREAGQQHAAHRHAGAGGDRRPVPVGPAVGRDRPGCDRGPPAARAPPGPEGVADRLDRDRPGGRGHGRADGEEPHARAGGQRRRPRPRRLRHHRRAVREPRGRRLHHQRPALLRHQAGLRPPRRGGGAGRRAVRHPRPVRHRQRARARHVDGPAQQRRPAGLRGRAGGRRRGPGRRRPPVRGDGRRPRPGLLPLADDRHRPRRLGPPGGRGAVRAGPARPGLRLPRRGHRPGERLGVRPGVIDLDGRRGTGRRPGPAHPGRHDVHQQPRALRPRPERPVRGRQAERRRPGAGLRRAWPPTPSPTPSPPGTSNEKGGRMATFANAQQVYDTIGLFLDQITKDPETRAQVRGRRHVVPGEVHRPRVLDAGRRHASTRRWSR